MNKSFLCLLGESKASGMDVPCEIHKKNIERQIMDIEQIEECTDEIEDERCQMYYDEMEFNEYDPCDFSKWLENIKLEAEETVAEIDDGKRDNLMFNPSFASHFLHLCKMMLLWSGICCRLFNSPNITASSGNVESAFKVIKQTLDDVIPTSVDNFIKHHLDMIDGEVKEASQKYVHFVGNVPADLSDTDATVVEEEAVQINTQRVQDLSAYSPQMCENEIVEHPIQIECIACSNGHLPSEAHTCMDCGENVHIFPECSISIGDSEGYGEKRICMTCSRSKERQKIVPSGDKIAKAKKTVKSQEATEMNYEEKWGRKKATKKSKYLQPDPLWTAKMNINMNKVPMIGILANANRSSTIYKVNKTMVALENTCAFDAIVQVN